MGFSKEREYYLGHAETDSFLEALACLNAQRTSGVDERGGRPRYDENLFLFGGLFLGRLLHCSFLHYFGFGLAAALSG